MAFVDLTSHRNKAQSQEKHRDKGASEHSLAVSGYLRAADSYRVANMCHSAAVALKEAATHMVQSDSSPTEVTTVLTDCLSLANSGTDQSILGELYLSVGVVFCQVRSFHEAVQCFQKALNSASQLQQRPLLAKVLLNLGAALNAVGEYKAALEYHRLAAKLYVHCSGPAPFTWEMQNHLRGNANKANERLSTTSMEEESEQ
ncbi:hypothetical protein WMY93_025814 [Mugilogobius chulae]|uniref:Uncharacterized protein n=1 Tax=Mugilogobius chulae TaxID=88201 RepID=A0AAW0N091_9GOBI